MLRSTGKDQHKRSIWSVIPIPVLAILTGLDHWRDSDRCYQQLSLCRLWRVLLVRHQNLLSRDRYSLRSSLLQVQSETRSQSSSAFQNGDPKGIREALNPFLESLVQATPYIFAGLAVCSRISRRAFQHWCGRSIVYWGSLLQLMLAIRLPVSRLYSYAAGSSCRCARGCYLGFHPWAIKGHNWRS